LQVVGERLCDIGCVADHYDVFAVSLVGSFGEVEAAGDDDGLVDDQIFAVLIAVFVPDVYFDSGFDQFGDAGIFAGGVFQIHDHSNLYAALMGADDGIGDAGMREGEGCDVEGVLGAVNQFDDDRGDFLLRREVRFDGDGWLCCGCAGSGGGRFSKRNCHQQWGQNEQ
jgi:hypothetical protein